MNIAELSRGGIKGARAAVVALTLAAGLSGACAREEGERPDRAHAEPTPTTAGDPAGGAGMAAAGADARPAAPELVDVLALDPTFVLDVRYATPRNFTGRTLYPVARCLLRADAAERLVRVHERLRREGLRLRLFDCYRPLSIQRVLWALVPDERYVANPAQGSRHNRGAAVDLTLADSSGRALPMPTEYDTFTERAHRDWTGGDPARLANRERLERAMLAEDFEPLPTEWWHFDAAGWERHAVLDVPLAKVGRADSTAADGLPAPDPPR